MWVLKFLIKKRVYANYLIPQTFFCTVGSTDQVIGLSRYEGNGIAELRREELGVDGDLVGSFAREERFW